MNKAAIIVFFAVCIVAASWVGSSTKATQQTKMLDDATLPTA
jgi:hypothetical protein